MDKVDVIIIGGATSGSYFAKKMAEKDFSVAVIEKCEKDKVGSRYDIFHVRDEDFARFSLPRPHEGDKEWAFEFSHNVSKSPSDAFPKHTYDLVVGMHMHDYTVRLNEWAESKGARFIYGAAFSEFIFEDGKIVGVKYACEGGETALYARVVVDCSGINAEPRRALPAGYGVDNLALTNEDMFYVVLKYVELNDEKDYLSGTSTGWTFYKSWIAPQADPHGAILGVGGCHSYEYAESVMEKCEQNIVFPKYKLIRTERGRTPYTRPPYSFVGDNFIASGDSARLTKPTNGEGVTSSMVQIDVACDVLCRALSRGVTDKEALWEINTRYNKEQGADFSSMRALVTKALGASEEEFNFYYKHDIIFSEKFLSPPKEDGSGEMTFGDMAKMFFWVLVGLVSGKIKGATFRELTSGLSLSGKIKKLYLSFPTSPNGFEEWSKKADALWLKVGKMK